MREKKKSRTVVQKGFFLPKMRRNIEKRERKTENAAVVSDRPQKVRLLPK